MAAKSVGRRRTSQREAIAQVFRKTNGPLTVEQIHARAAQTIPRLGTATVYRTIKLLIDTGRIHNVVMPDGEMRYESADLDHHHHFHCRACKQVFDLPGCPLPPSLEPAFPEGFEVDSHEVTLFGTCPKCSGEKKAR